MGELFAALILGHLFGDYVFQNKWMAGNKFKDTLLGYWTCAVHCLVYSACVCSALNIFGFNGWSGMVFFVVYLTHFPIDKYSLALYWMKRWGHDVDFKRNPFVPLIYAVVDNTFHLALMMLLLRYLTWK